MQLVGGTREKVFKYMIFPRTEFNDFDAELTCLTNSNSYRFDIFWFKLLIFSHPYKPWKIQYLHIGEVLDPLNSESSIEPGLTSSVFQFVKVRQVLVDL